MPNPKHKLSRSRKGSRRAHDKLTAPSFTACANCGSPKLQHRVCPECGHYRGMVAVEKKVTA